MKTLFKFIMILTAISMLVSYFAEQGHEKSLSNEARTKASIERHAALEAKKAAREQAIIEREANCRHIEGCWINKHKALCHNYLGAIKKHAKYQARWEGRPRFSRFGWKEKKGYVVCQGDEVSFQNGFGAWQRHIYTLTLDPATNSLVDIKVSPGQF